MIMGRKLLQLLIFFIGLGIIVGSFYYVSQFEEKFDQKYYFHMPSFLLIVFVSIGLVLCSFQINVIMKMIYHLIFFSPARMEAQYNSISSQLKNICELYYREGAQYLEQYIKQTNMPIIWKTILIQLEAQISPEDVRDLTMYNANKFEDDMNRQINILTTVSSITPSLGLLGTVLGLVKLLNQLDDLASLGPNMALALIATLYGIFFSVIVINPLVAHLEDIRDCYLRFYDQSFFWLKLIDEKKPSYFCDPKFMDKKKIRN